MARNATSVAAALVIAVACSSPNDGGMMGGVVPGPTGAGAMATPPLGTSGTTGNVPPLGSAGSTALPPGPGNAGTTAVPPVGGTGVTPPVGGSGPVGPGAGMNDTTESTISRECRGFSFDGLIYSPGGDALPDACMPFHPTTNNPYAVRCVDVWPWYETQFPGDEYCILPPPPDRGTQYGSHPQGKEWFAQVSTGDMSGYANPSDDFTMSPGAEEEVNHRTGSLNPMMGNYYRSHVRMRAGSHHMIVSTAAASMPQEVWSPGSPDGLFGGTSLPGAQRPDENTPKSLTKPTEDEGLFAVIPAMTGVTNNLHHFNSTDTPILKETWTNLWWETNTVTQVRGILGLSLLQVATLAVAPNTTADLHYAFNISQPIRLLTVFGHRHAWTTNFSAWVEKPGGETEIVYQSFDWFDQPTYRYDSMTQNPVPAPESLTDGASSGIRMLNTGERLHFNCHIDYTDARAQTVSSPVSPGQNGTLRFANQAFSSEMCILFGSTAGVSLGTPGEDLTPLPSFATVD